MSPTYDFTLPKNPTPTRRPGTFPLPPPPNDWYVLKKAADATEAALRALIATKQNTLVSGENIKTINGQTILGSGNLDVSYFANWETIINKPKCEIEDLPETFTEDEMRTKLNSLLGWMRTNFAVLTGCVLMASGAFAEPQVLTAPKGSIRNTENIVTNVTGLSDIGHDIRNNKYILDADLNYIRLREPTNSFAFADGYGTTVSDVERIWGTASATNFEYIGVIDGTSIWQNVYLDNGVCKTNSITLDVGMILSEKEGYGYLNATDLIHGLKQRDGVSYSAYIPKGGFIYNVYSDEHGGLVDYSIKIAIDEVFGSTENTIVYECQGIANNGNTVLLTEKNGVRYAEVPFSPRESDYGNVRYYNKSMQCCLTNRWYEYNFHTQDGSYSNTFYTTDSGLILTNHYTSTPEWGTTLTFPLYASAIPGQNCVIVRPRYGEYSYHWQYGSYTSEVSVSVLDKLSGEYTTVSNLVCNVTPHGDGSLEWINIDTSRFDYLDDIMITRDRDVYELWSQTNTKLTNTIVTVNLNYLTNVNSRAWSETAIDNSVIKRIDNLEAEIVGVNALLETALGGNN